MRKLILVSATLAGLGGAVPASTHALAQNGVRVDIEQLRQRDPEAARRFEEAERGGQCTFGDSCPGGSTPPTTSPAPALSSSPSPPSFGRVQPAFGAVRSVWSQTERTRVFSAPVARSWRRKFGCANGNPSSTIPRYVVGSDRSRRVAAGDRFWPLLGREVWFRFPLAHLRHDLGARDSGNPAGAGRVPRRRLVFCDES